MQRYAGGRGRADGADPAIEALRRNRDVSTTVEAMRASKLEQIIDSSSPAPAAALRRP